MRGTSKNAEEINEKTKKKKLVLACTATIHLHDRLLALSCGVSPCLPPRTAAISVVFVDEGSPPLAAPKKEPPPPPPSLGLSASVADAASSASALAAASSATFEKSRFLCADSNSAHRSISPSIARLKSENTPGAAQTSDDEALADSASACHARAWSRKRWSFLTRLLVSVRHLWKWDSDCLLVEVDLGEKERVELS